VLEGNAGLFALPPSGRSGVELSFAFIKLQRSVMTHHPGNAGTVDQRHHLGFGKPHQRRLGFDGSPVAAGKAGLPELPEPGCEPRQIGGADGQRS
jgi:hypothetical protein